MVKKLNLMMLSLSVSGLASAGMYSTTPPAPACVPDNVTVPCDARLWDIGVHALYLKPLYDTYIHTFTDKLEGINPDFGWGYRVEGSYHFNTGNDITLNWSHYDVDSNLGYFEGEYVQLLPGGASMLAPASYTSFIANKFEQVNLIMGQHVDMGLVKKARFYAGGQYADIQVDRERFYNVSPIFLSGTGGGVRSPINVDFNGFGPTMGVDYAYTLPAGLGLVANAATSILYGSSRFEQMTSYNNGLIIAPTYISKKKIVPSFEAKLGINYAHSFAQGVLSAEGGYQVINYFNALQDSSVLTTFTPANSNFGLYGPYFSVKWLGIA